MDYEAGAIEKRAVQKKDQRKKSFETLLGKICFQRWRVKDVFKKKYIYPVDEWIGLKGRQKESPPLRIRGGGGELNNMRFIINNPSLKNRRRRLRKRQTDAEYKLWQRLRNRQIYGLKFYRQYSVESYILDFYCPQKKLVIELDHSQHLASKKYDDIRETYFKQWGMTTIRFWDDVVLKETDLVVEVIWEKLHEGKNHESNSP